MHGILIILANDAKDSTCCPTTNTPHTHTHSAHTQIGRDMQRQTMTHTHTHTHTAKTQHNKDKEALSHNHTHTHRPNGQVSKRSNKPTHIYSYIQHTQTPMHTHTLHWIQQDHTHCMGGWMSMWLCLWRSVSPSAFVSTCELFVNAIL